MTDNIIYISGLAVDGLYANGTTGLPGQVLATDGTNLFWANSSGTGNTDITLDGGGAINDQTTIYDGGGPYDTPSGSIDGGFSNIGNTAPLETFDGGLASAGSPTSTLDGGAITDTASTTYDGGSP
jgi:hypothetical protein